MALRIYGVGAIAAAVLMTGAPVVAKSASDVGIDAGDKLICKFRARTGTRFASKSCRTVTEWEAIAEANRLAFADAQNRPNPNVGCVNQNAGSSPATIAISGSC